MIASTVNDTGHNMDSQDTDIKQFEQYEHHELISVDPAEEKKVLRKIDLYLMPSIFVLYLFSFVDRSNIGLAEVAGMQKALHLSSQQYYYAVILWVIGYAAAAVPSNMILVRVRPSIYIPIIMCAWGIVAALLAAVKKPSHLLVLRFFLGVFEAGFSPSVLFLISTWYRKREQSKRFMYFLSAGILSGAFGSVAAGAITSRLNGVHGIAGWRWLFLVEGVATIGVSFITTFFLIDYPATCKKFSPVQRKIAVERLQQDNITSAGATGEHTYTHLQAFGKVALNWRVWLLALGYMTIIGALSISYFYPTLVKGLGYTSTAAQYMTAPLYLVALFVALPTCFIADRMPQNRGLILAACLVGGGIFCALTAGIQAYVARYVFLCFINSAIWTGNALALSFASTALGSVDPEVRAIALALMNGCGGLAQLYGSALFPSEDAPVYLLGFTVYAACFFVGGVAYISAHFLFRKLPFTKSPAVHDEE